MRRHHILIFCAAIIATLPLLVSGCSCGHDIDFHLQSWLDAAQQFRHGTLLPHWAFSAAYNAGEPRFVFYPPLSWMFGALLTLIFPSALLPSIYTFTVLAAAGFAMHHLARHFVSPNAALLAATLYVVNPYMLFNAFERTAYAELLAAVWLPLLFLAVLRERPAIRGIALPVALLWLTNAPAAVMGCYALALIIIVRIAIRLYRASGPDAIQPMRLAAISIGGTALGLALPAFYLIPAAYERRFVQIAMAIIPNMRFQDNFLFGHTGDGPHDQVLHTASSLALALLLITIGVLIALWFSSRDARGSGTKSSSQGGAAIGETRFSSAILFILAILTLCIAFLVNPISTPIWNHLPELAFLQFPWRLLSVLAVVLALALALLLRNVRLRTALTIPLALALAAPLTFFGIHQYRQPCEATDLPVSRARAFQAHQGIDPTDEYTPNAADNDVLRADDPPYWLSPNPAAFASGTTSNPMTLTGNNAPKTDATAIAAPRDTIPPTFAPDTFAINAPTPEFAILNLRGYPAWRIQVNGHTPAPYTGNPRDDGLVVVPVDRGLSTIRIEWRRTRDQQLGLALSGIAACVYLALLLRARSRRIVV